MLYSRFCSRNLKPPCHGCTRNLHHVFRFSGQERHSTFAQDTSNLKCSYYRLLGPLERQMVMNLLWLDSAIPASTVVAWVTREGRKYVQLPQGSNVTLLTDFSVI